MNVCSMIGENKYLNLSGLYMFFTLCISVIIGTLIGLILFPSFFSWSPYILASVPIIFGSCIILYISKDAIYFVIKFEKSKVILTGLYGRRILDQTLVQKFILGYPMLEVDKMRMDCDGFKPHPIGFYFYAIMKNGKRISLGDIWSGYLIWKIVETINVPIEYSQQKNPREQ